MSTNGIGFIIPNADFSNSPLGTVTVILTNKQKAMKVANDYGNAIGTGQYYDAIYNLVFSMLKEGLWDKTISLFPILGDTIAKQIIDLKGYSDMKVFANASAGTKKIDFSNTTCIGNVLSGKQKYLMYTNTESNYGMILRADTNSFAANTNNPVSNQISFRFTSTQKRRVNLSFAYKDAVDCNWNDRYYYCETPTDTYFYCNNELVRETTNDSAHRTFKNMFGCRDTNYTGTEGETIPASTDLFSGSLYYFALGYFNQIEILKINDIFTAFETAVGKV